MKDIDGCGQYFQQTSWTQIEAAATSDLIRRRERVGTILEQYSRPVYAYLRRKGKRGDEARDLMQGFFTEVVLGRGLIQQADRTKGRFRALLLTSLDRYVRSVRRAQTARKRMPAGGLVYLGHVEPAEVHEANAQATPEEAFVFAWACELLEQVIAKTEAACREAGQEVHWRVFRRTVLEPILEGADRPPLAQLVDEMGIESQVRASNMIMMVKRRFRAVLRARVRPSVDCDQQVDQEIRDLMEILSKHADRS